MYIVISGNALSCVFSFHIFVFESYEAYRSALRYTMFVVKRVRTILTVQKKFYTRLPLTTPSEYGAWGLYLFTGEVPSWTNHLQQIISDPGWYNIIIAREDYEHLATPFRSNCSKPIFSTVHNFPPSRSLCRQICIATHMFNTCSTVGDYWWKYLPTHAREKNKTNEIAARKCIDYVLYDSPIPCKCTKPCQETIYSTKLAKYGTSKKDFHLTIYFDRLVIKKSTELPAYDTTRFMADVGGVVGLLVGMSFLSIFEVIICVVLYAVDVILILVLKLFAHRHIHTDL